MKVFFCFLNKMNNLRTVLQARCRQVYKQPCPPSSMRAACELANTLRLREEEGNYFLSLKKKKERESGLRPRPPRKKLRKKKLREIRPYGNMQRI